MWLVCPQSQPHLGTGDAEHRAPHWIWTSLCFPGQLVNIKVWKASMYKIFFLIPQSRSTFLTPWVSAKCLGRLVTPALPHLHDLEGRGTSISILSYHLTVTICQLALTDAPPVPCPVRMLGYWKQLFSSKVEAPLMRSSFQPSPIPRLTNFIIQTVITKKKKEKKKLSGFFTDCPRLVHVLLKLGWVIRAINVLGDSTHAQWAWHPIIGLFGLLPWRLSPAQSLETRERQTWECQSRGIDRGLRSFAWRVFIRSDFWPNSCYLCITVRRWSFFFFLMFLFPEGKHYPPNKMQVN